MMDAPVSPLGRALAGLPEPLRAGVEQHWNAFLEACERDSVPPPTHPELLRVLCRVWAGSDYVAGACRREPALLAGLLESGDLLCADAPGELAARLEQFLGKPLNDDHLGQLLRRFRRREMVRSYNFV